LDLANFEPSFADVSEAAVGIFLEAPPEEVANP
jgi:hypothetical protein